MAKIKGCTIESIRKYERPLNKSQFYQQSTMSVYKLTKWFGLKQKYLRVSFDNQG